MKKFLLTTFATLVAFSSSADNVAEVKVNLAAGMVTIFNPSVEVGFGSNSAITFDYIGVFAKENFIGTGDPFMFSMGLFGYRHYLLNDQHKGLFISGDLGLDVFRMGKDFVMGVVDDHGAGVYYDVGYGYVLGATLGYKYQFHRRWGLEASVSYGFHHSQHELYDHNGIRLNELNASAEWLPYKAGIYISYKLFDK